MILKYYGEYPNVPEAIKYYQSIFEVKVIKNGINQSLTTSMTHGNIKLFNDVTLLLNVTSKKRDKVGNLILSFNDNEKSKYLEAVTKIENHPEVKIVYLNHEGKWGTTLTKFIDKYGYNWTLEISTKALK